MSLANLLLPLLVFGQTPSDKRVTYTTVAKPAVKVLKELSDIASTKIDADPEAGQEILLISVKDAPLSDVMARIATAASCKWRALGTGYRLVPNDVVRAREERDEIAEKAKKIAEALRAKQQEFEELRNPKDKKGNPVGSVAKENGQRSLTMGGSELICKLLTLIGPQQLALVGNEDRVVFASDRRTSMQVALPDGSSDSIASWIEERNAAMAGLPPLVVTRVATDMTLARARMEMRRRARQPISLPIGKAILVVSAGPEQDISDSLFAELDIYDRAGLVLSRSVTDLHLGVQPGSDDGSDEADQNSTPKNTSSEKIEFSEEAKEFGALNSNDGSGLSDGSLNYVEATPEFLAKVFRPDVKDPLAYGTSDLLLAVAKHENRQIVAGVPDSAIAMAFAADPRAEIGIDEAKKMVESGDFVDAKDDGTFLSIRPAKPAGERRSRLNRGALAQILAAVYENRVASLSDICRFALSSPPGTQNAIEGIFESVFFGRGGVIPTDPAPWGLLRFYGSLDEGQRGQAASEAGLSFAMLDGTQSALLETLLFGDETSAGIDVEQSGTENDDPFRVDQSRFYQQADFTREPTELMPGGVPREGRLRISGFVDPVMQPILDKPKLMFGVLGPEAFQPADLRSSDPTSPAPPPSGVLGTRAVLTLRFWVAANTKYRWQLADTHVPRDGRIIQSANLPDEFKARAAYYSEEFRSLGGRPGGGAVAGGTGSGSIPPE